MIGSRNKIAAMRSEFIENGLATPDQWEKVYTPIGLDIKSRTVEEIAISIAAQLVLVRNNKQ
jgi:xanthine dehydrogenase accessory factor